MDFVVVVSYKHTVGRDMLQGIQCDITTTMNAEYKLCSNGKSCMRAVECAGVRLETNGPMPLVYLMRKSIAISL